MNGTDEDVKMTNGVEGKDEKIQANGGNKAAASSSQDTVMNDDSNEGQTKPDPVVELKICHRCYYVRSEERSQSVVVELNTPIVTV